MPFNENIKQKVKERAHFKCCLCHETWATEIHHIIPESEDGPNEEDNAAPLCATCHDLYGANPEKCKFIKDNRDFWYSLCERKSPPNPEVMREINERLCNVATKNDVQNIIVYLEQKFQNIMSQPITPKEQLVRLSDVTTSTTAAISGVTILPNMTTCHNCYTRFEINNNNYTCPKCGQSNDLVDLVNRLF